MATGRWAVLWAGVWIACTPDVQPTATGTTSAALGGWTAGKPMSIGRRGHIAVPLASGKVLVAGGDFISSAELYDPASNSWSPAGSMSENRRDYAAATLLSGKVLVTGGSKDSGQAIATADIYNPATNTWSPAAPMAAARQMHTATTLPNGKVLVVGGASPGVGSWVVGTAEIYDPATNTWAPAGFISTSRTLHAATLLNTGKVLVTGGETRTASSVPPTYLTTAELYDPLTNTWALAKEMTFSRSRHTSTLLADGRVLVAAGSWPWTATAEVYEPIANTWSVTAPLSYARDRHAAVRLPSGRVLVVGGAVATTYVAPAEIWNPADGKWTAAGSLVTPREDHTATLLNSGLVLVAGGRTTKPPPTPEITYLSSTELFAPAAIGAACSGSAECTSGYCVDGVCCNGACEGQCQACNLPSAVGTCTVVNGTNGPAGYPSGQAVTGFGTTIRPYCSGYGTTCGARCDGTTVNSCAFATGACGAPGWTCRAGVCTAPAVDSSVPDVAVDTASPVEDTATDSATSSKTEETGTAETVVAADTETDQDTAIEEDSMTDTSTDLDTGTAAAPFDEQKVEISTCGCTTPGSSRSASPWIFIVGALLFVRRRRSAIVFAALLAVGCSSRVELSTERDDAGPPPSGNVVGAPCSPAGALACQGAGQKLQLLCDGSKWISNGVCAGDQVCDPRPGPTLGSCQTPKCSGANVCEAAVLVTCAADQLTVVREECATKEHCRQAVRGVCAKCLSWSAKCEGAALYRCSGDRQNLEFRETCASAAQCDALGGTCKAAECVPGAHRCVGDALEECNPTGSAYYLVTTCGPGACDAAAGACKVACAAGDHRCSGDVLEKCDATLSSFEPVSVCLPGRCDAANRECDDCKPGAAECFGEMPRACDSAGHWKSLAPCTGTAKCVGGVCVTPPMMTCTSGHVRCTGDALETCRADGLGYELTKTCDPGWCNAALKGCIPPTMMGSTFPASTSITWNPYAGMGTLGSGGGMIHFTSGAYVEDKLARALPVTKLDVNFRMYDGTSTMCAVGTLTWAVKLNGVEVGKYSWVGGTLSDRIVVQSYTFPPIAPIDGTIKIRYEATSTVCSGGGSWNWYPGGTAAMY